MYDYFEILMYIAGKKGMFGQLESSTAVMARELKISQQSVSRKLRDMEAKGLIKREVRPDGISIAIAEKGRDLLKQNFDSLSRIFSSRDSVSGTAKSGIGEGAYYVSLAGYQSQFAKKLGFKAFNGTLNLQIDRKEANEFLADQEEINIAGFSTKLRTFGQLKCFKVKVNNVDAAIVIPERARHSEDIIEIVAPVCLRDKLRLKESSKVTITK